MIAPSEFRIGNYLLQKLNNKIIQVQCNYQHFEMFARGDINNFYPLLLKAELLEKCSFIENKKYALLPDAREFMLTIPVIGKNKNEIVAYIKNNKECFGRAVIDNLPASNNIYHLHQLQNLYFALTSEELAVKL
ncbi:MAG TPA: hypothetical protein VGO09_10300 [Flavisolibacter sp.]|jgi:hypothetical protein|nr:hypothetical protein [Flavisolibacter sp.]